MKITKALLIALITTTFSSCGGDDDNMGDQASLSFQVGNTTYEFDSFDVFLIENSDLDLTDVEANMSNSTAQKANLIFITNQLQGTFEFFMYELDGADCNDFQGDMEYNLTVNNDSQITGSFSGSVSCSGNGPDEAIVSNGMINISF